MNVSIEGIDVLYLSEAIRVGTCQHVGKVDHC